MMNTDCVQKHFTKLGNIEYKNMLDYNKYVPLNADLWCILE